MSNVVIIGAQWGDEGKGKIVDILALDADIIVRFQGGPNAGHTVVVGDEKIILHQIPSGILHQGKTCVIGNGVVLDIETLMAEMQEVKVTRVIFRTMPRCSSVKKQILSCPITSALMLPVNH